MRHCPSGLCFHETLYLTFPSSMRVMTSASLCPSDQPTKILGCSSSLILFSDKNSFQESSNIARCFVSCVCFMWRDFDCSTATQSYIALHKKVLDPFGMSHCPLRNKVVEYDLSTSTSCTLNHDLQPFSQRSHALLSSSVRLALFNCCHSCWNSKSSCCTVYNFTQALFLVTVRWNLSIPCLQHLQELFEIFECCSLPMNGSRKRFSTQSSTNQDLDFCNCLSRMRRHSSHFDTRFASRIICGVSSSLVRDPSITCHFTFHVLS